MIKNKFVIGIGLSLTASASFAGGLDRSMLSSSILFEEGNAFRIGASYVDPSVDGVAAGLPTGDMSESYTMLSLGFKSSINDAISYAVLVDTPYGAAVKYSESSSPFNGTKADLSSFRISALLKYSFTDRVSVFGGPIVEQVGGGSVEVPFAGYKLKTGSNTGFGYAVGAAYEVPEKAVRVALTYSGGIEHSIDTTENGASTGSMDIKTPQSVALEMQTGLNSKTLLSGSIRWSEWSAFTIEPPAFYAANGQPLISYENDVVTLGLGLGYKLTDKWALLGGLEHEAAEGGDASILAPTDGRTSINLGTQYTMNQSKFRIGLSYAMLGNASNASAPFEFKDNSALGLGLSFTQGF